MWIVIHGKVYDVTRFDYFQVSKFDKHPGTFAPLIKNAGTDATEKFEAVEHSQEARKWMQDYEIGEVQEQACQ